MPKLNPRSRHVILRAALRIARSPGGWSSITRERIAKRANCAESLVSYYMGSMDEMRRTLMTIAIDREYLDLISQGLATGDPAARALSSQLKQKAATYMLQGK